MTTSPRQHLATGTDKMEGFVDDGVGWMIYNNPARHNALSLEMIQAVPRILEALDADPEVAAIVVTGAGNRAFVSGADISEFEDRRTAPEARVIWDRASAESFGIWGRLDTPIIAMIRGYCIGGGLLTAMQADIRIATTDSQFGVPAARLGVGYPSGGIAQLSALVGPSWAAEILFTGRRLNALEAERIGLVNRIVADNQLEAEIATLTSAITANAPLSIRASKIALRELRVEPARRDTVRVDQAIETCFRSEDYQEGQRAFMEKRTPQFRGR